MGGSDGSKRLKELPSSALIEPIRGLRLEPGWSRAARGRWQRRAAPPSAWVRGPGAGGRGRWAEPGQRLYGACSWRWSRLSARWEPGGWGLGHGRHGAGRGWRGAAARARAHAGAVPLDPVLLLAEGERRRRLLQHLDRGARLRGGARRGGAGPGRVRSPGAEQRSGAERSGPGRRWLAASALPCCRRPRGR